MQSCKGCLTELIRSLDIFRSVLGQQDFGEVELCTAEGLVGPRRERASLVEDFLEPIPADFVVSNLFEGLEASNVKLTLLRSSLS